MDLDFTPEQDVLREVVRRLCRDHSPLETVRALEDDPAGYSTAFWSRVAELGIAGILIPEEYEGSGQSLLEAAIVYEEFGRALAPSPHFVSAVLGAGALLRAGSPEQRTEWLPRVARGEAVVTPAWLEPAGGYGPRGVRMRAEIEGGAYRLSGTKRHVAFARSASRLLALVRTGAGDADLELVLVDPGAPGVELVQERSLAGDAQYRVEFRDARVPVANRVGPPSSGGATWDAVMHDGIVLLAAQAIGGAARALEITVEYAKQRVQFEKPLGAFQAISHYLADAATLVDGGRTLVYEAAWARAGGRPVDRLAPMAKLFACQTFREVTAMAQQVWGGVGFTIDYDIQLYFRRAKQLELSWWDGRHLEEQVARAVLDGPDAPRRTRAPVASPG